MQPHVFFEACSRTATWRVSYAHPNHRFTQKGPRKFNVDAHFDGDCMHDGNDDCNDDCNNYVHNSHMPVMMMGMAAMIVVMLLRVTIVLQMGTMIVRLTA